MSVTIERLRDLHENAFTYRMRGVRPPCLKALAAFINETMPWLKAELEPWSHTPYRKIGRLITYTGRMRRGLRLCVRRKEDGPFDRPVFEHNPVADSYATNWDVVRWIVETTDATRRNAGKSRKSRKHDVS